MSDPIFQKIGIVTDSNFDWSHSQMSVEFDGREQIFALSHPRKMYDSVLSKYRSYCPNDASRLGNMIYNDDAEVTIWKSETGEFRFDVRLLHMEHPWISLICTSVEFPE